MALCAGLIFAIPAAPEKPDSDQVKASLRRPRSRRGAMGRGKLISFVKRRGRIATDPLIEPTQIFENVFVIGNQNHRAYRTSAGC
jgi:hypothetical protein